MKYREKIKVWKDAHEVTKTFDVDPKLWEYEDLMKSIPNFDKSEIKEIYQKKIYKGPKK